MAKHNNRFNRARLLATAGSAMAATMMVSAVQAAETVVTPDTPVTTTVTGHAIVDSVSVNAADIIADVTSTTGGVGEQTSPTGTSTITVDGNDIQSTALGNNAEELIELETLDDDDDGNGVASSVVQINVGAIASDVDDNDIFVSLDDFTDGSASVVGNDMDADATGNASQNVLAGEIPVTYADGSIGDSLLTTDADWLDAEGTLVASTVQIQENPDVTAQAGDGNANYIFLELNSTDDNVVVSSPEVLDNSINADATGNSSSSLISVESGSAPAFSGSAVITNGQSNSADGVAEISAYNYSEIYAEIEADDSDDINELQGTLTVSGNTLSTSATGNAALGSAPGEAGNRIVLADGMSFTGPGTAADVDVAYDNGDVSSDVAADIIINNGQGNVGSENTERLAIEAYSDENYIYSVLDLVNTGAVIMEDNVVSAMARGNAASSSFETGTGVAYFDGTVALSNQQSNLYTSVDAENYDAYIDTQIDGDDDWALIDSSALVDGNVISASGYGNQVSQNVSIEATDMDMPADGVLLTGGTGPDGNIAVDGNMVISNLQSVYSSNVDGYLSDGYIQAIVNEDITGSSISITENTQEALALGNSAGNTLDLSGTSVEAGAGIASVQILADDSYVDAHNDSLFFLDADGEDIFGSTLNMSGNLARAVAYGGSAGNTLTIDAETIVIDETIEEVSSSVNFDSTATDGFVLDYGVASDAPAIDAAYGVLNVQSVSTEGDAGIEAYTHAEVLIYVDDVEAGSSVNNDDNAVVAAAYGTNSANRGDLSVGNLTSSDEDFVSVLNVTNVQTVTGASTVYAEASMDDDLIETQIGGDVLNSSVSTSGNTVQALAYSNLSDNDLIVSSTNIDTEADFDPSRGSASVLDSEATTDASFGINNVQFAGGEAVATLLDDQVDPEFSANVLTDIEDDVEYSSVLTNDNLLSAGVTGNRTDNLLDLSGNTLATTGAVTNFQIMEASLTASIGIEGSDPTPFVPGTPEEPAYSFATSGEAAGTMSVSGDDLTLGSPAVLTFTGASFSQREVDYLNGLAGVSGASLGGSTVTLTGTVDTTAFNGFIYDAGAGGSSSGDESITLSGFDVPLVPAVADVPATPGTPNIGGVVASVQDSSSLILASTIEVNGNAAAGSVTGNSASNSAALVGTDVADGSDHFVSSVVIDDLDTEAEGDVMVANVQVVGDAELDSSVYNTFAIDTDDFVVITSSTLTVDGNSQSSRAVANTAINSVDLEATNTGAGASLGSNQSVFVSNVGAVSNLDIFAPVASGDSTVSMSDNSNLAVAVGNNVTNSVVVDTTNADETSIPGNAYVDVDDEDVVALGDHVLANQQWVEESLIGSSAVTTIYNDDLIYDETPGVQDGSVMVEGNSTLAEASANRAVNSMDVSAGSTLQASAGVVNSQVSSASVIAGATTDAGIALYGELAGSDAVVDTSSVTLGGNTTSALARGNAATNALNYSAGSNYGEVAAFFDPASATFASDNVNVTARAAVLNDQDNFGPVTAQSTDASYVIALNSGAADQAVTNATIGVIGNSVSAAAYGNTANNSLSVAPLNTGMATAGIGNSQNNLGQVTASVTTVSYGVTSGLGAVAGSSLSVSGNSVTATAVGNNAVSAITAGN